MTSLYIIEDSFCSTKSFCSFPLCSSNLVIIATSDMVEGSKLMHIYKFTAACNCIALIKTYQALQSYIHRSSLQSINYFWWDTLEEQWKRFIYFENLDNEKYITKGIKWPSKYKPLPAEPLQQLQFDQYSQVSAFAPSSEMFLD